MLNFKEIEKSDIEEYKKYYDYSNAIGCEYNLLNAYLWRKEYPVKFAVYDDTLIRAYFRENGTLWVYCMPTGKNIKGALYEILVDADERGINPELILLTNGQKAMLESLCPSKFVFERDPVNQDYVYLTKDLVMLAGKKYHAKRNHISRFYRTYNETHFETLDSSNQNDAIKVVLEWCKENNVNPDYHKEVEIISEALQLRDEFGMKGALIYVEDKPVAMTLGSEISPLAFDIIFEKALRAYDGLYAVINNEFAKTLTQYEYINREEDMGIEGLRKSKLSYNPYIIIDRYIAKLK